MLWGDPQEGGAMAGLAAIELSRQIHDRMLELKLAAGLIFILQISMRISSLLGHSNQKHTGKVILENIIWTTQVGTLQRPHGPSLFDLAPVHIALNHTLQRKTVAKSHF